MSATAWTAAARSLEPLLAAARFELRYGPEGDVAIRQYGGPLAALHAEPPDPAAAWSARARCGHAAGWLLADRAPEDPRAAQEILARAMERHTAERLQALHAARMALES